MKNNFKYRLLHITTEQNYKEIELNGFAISKHSQLTNQWLGDGIYFWDGNSEESCNLGVRLVKNKKGNENQQLVCIFITRDFENNKHLNLDDPENELLIKEFASSNEIESSKYFDFVKFKEAIDKKRKKKVGYFLGSLINLYISFLKEKNINIDIVSYSFYYRNIQSILMPSRKIYIRQFCVKNEKLINSIDPKFWEIEYIK